MAVQYQLNQWFFYRRKIFRKRFFVLLKGKPFSFFSWWLKKLPNEFVWSGNTFISYFYGCTKRRICFIGNFNSFLKNNQNFFSLYTKRIILYLPLKKYRSQENLLLYHCQNLNKQIYHQFILVSLWIVIMNTVEKICLHQELEVEKTSLKHSFKNWH